MKTHKVFTHLDCVGGEGGKVSVETMQPSISENKKLDEVPANGRCCDYILSSNLESALVIAVEARIKNGDIQSAFVAGLQANLNAIRAGRRIQVMQ